MLQMIETLVDVPHFRSQIKKIGYHDTILTSNSFLRLKMRMRPNSNFLSHVENILVIAIVFTLVGKTLFHSLPKH